VRNQAAATRFSGAQSQRFESKGSAGFVQIRNRADDKIIHEISFLSAKSWSELIRIMPRAPASGDAVSVQRRLP